MTDITEQGLLGLIIKHARSAMGDDIDADTSLEDADSLDVVELVMALEGELDVDLNDFDTAGFTTPREAADKLFAFMEDSDDD